MLKTCLVIDDDPSFATFVQKVAESAGYVTRVLNDPARLEESLSAGAPDVITLDMEMPGRHGLDVLRVLSSRHLDDRVVIISGTPPASAGDKQQVNESGVVAILTKPVRKREIVTALSSALGPSRNGGSPDGRDADAADFIVPVGDLPVSGI
jgi:CheY-like chemotaxis protein